MRTCTASNVSKIRQMQAWKIPCIFFIQSRDGSTYLVCAEALAPLDVPEMEAGAWPAPPWKFGEVCAPCKSGEEDAVKGRGEVAD